MVTFKNSSLHERMRHIKAHFPVKVQISFSMEIHVLIDRTNAFLEKEIFQSCLFTSWVFCNWKFKCHGNHWPEIQNFIKIRTWVSFNGRRNLQVLCFCLLLEDTKQNRTDFSDSCCSSHKLWRKQQYFQGKHQQVWTKKEVATCTRWKHCEVFFCWKWNKHKQS